MIQKFLQEIPLQKKLVVALSLLFISVILFTGTLYSDIKELQSASRWLNHTHNVIAKTHNLIKLMIDQETGLRGFLIVGRDNFLEPFYTGEKQFYNKIHQLKITVSDNQGQVGLLNEIERLAHDWHLNAAQPEIAERRKVESNSNDISYLEELLSQGTGKSILDKQRVTVKELQKQIKNSQSLLDNGHLHDAELLAISLIKHIVDQETGQRGFLITGKDDFLEPLINGRKAFTKDLDKLKRLEGMDENLLDLLSDINGLNLDWYELAAGPEIMARRDINRTRASLKKVTALVESEIGKTLMDKIRSKVNLFVYNEKELIIKRKALNESQHDKTLVIAILGGGLVIITGLFIVFQINQTSKPLMKLITSMRNIAESSDFTRRVEVEGMYEVNRISDVFNQMALNTEQQAWMKSSSLEFSRVLQEADNIDKLADSLISKVGELLKCGFGAFYLYNEKTAAFELIGSYRFKERKHALTTYKRHTPAATNLRITYYISRDYIA